MSTRFLVGVLLAGATEAFFSTTSLYGQVVPPGFGVVVVSTNLDQDAVGFAVLPDERLLLIHQYSGQVQLLVNGVRRSQPLLTVPKLAPQGEKGLLGIAVDPDFPLQPYIYLFHTFDGNPDSNRVSRFTLSGELSSPASFDLQIDPASQLILVDDMPANNNDHNGGTIRFLPDKTLLISHGDDKNKGQVQRLDNLKGKILRINRDGSIPADNPKFPSEPAGKRPETFLIGLRNPFRFSVDPASGDLFIADVGQSSKEEIDLSTSRGGLNFGWPRYEGSLDFNTGAQTIPPSPTFPIWEYRLSGQNAVIALAAYRQQNWPNDFSFPPEYDGTLFYCDFYADTLFNLRAAGNGAWRSIPFATGFRNNPVDGALGSDGSIYILEYGYAISKIVYSNAPVPVELISFEGYAKGNSVFLNWRTASEQDSYGFNIQRRNNRGDFVRLAFVKGRGNTAQNTAYTYVDANPGAGRFTYRLKMIDVDGSFEYSPEISVEIRPPDEIELASNFPNPFNATTTIYYSVPQDGGGPVKTTLTIYNIYGREVKRLEDSHKPAGLWRVLWDGTDSTNGPVASGVYLLRLRRGGQVKSLKMILMR